MSLSQLRVIDFWYILENNTIEMLDLIPNRVYTHEDSLLLTLHWQKLYDEFHDLRNNKSSTYKIEKNYELARITLRLALLYDFENRLMLLNNIQNTPELSSFASKRTMEVIEDYKLLYPKVKVNIFSSILEVLSIVQATIKSQTNIYDEKVGVKEQIIAKQKQTVYDVVAIMSKVLGYSLNVNTMSCLEFIGHENAINLTQK